MTQLAQLDSFCSSSHNIMEEQFSDYTANDPWVQQTIVNLDNLMQSFKSGLTAANFDSLVMIVASEVTVHCEDILDFNDLEPTNTEEFNSLTPAADVLRSGGGEASRIR